MSIFDLTLTFEAYREKHTQEIIDMKKFFDEPCGDNPVLLDKKLDIADTYLSRLETILSYSEAYLDVAEAERVVGKSTKLSDMDRKLQLANNVYKERLFRNLIEGMINTAENRIKSLITRLSYHKTKV